jgi:glycosyltransferase involved in cell wall biosynthesis
MAAPVTPELGGATPGGVATHTVHLAWGLAEMGVEVDLLATNLPAGSPDEPIRAIGEDGRLRIHPNYLPSGRSSWLNRRYLDRVGLGPAVRYARRLRSYAGPPLGSRAAALGNLLWYRQFVLRVRPEVFHVQHPLERQLYARLLREWELLDLPLVVTLHSFFAEHPEEVIYGLMKPNLPHADALIAVGPSTADQAVMLGAERSKIQVIRSGVDTDHFRPRERGAARERLGITDEAKLVLFVGNLEPRKAVHVLIEALALVRRLVPVVLDVVGPGESAGADDQEPMLRQLAQERGVGSAVKFTGRVDDAELLDWYAAADVFALPSLSEAQGIVALEAMACGLPVVASRVGGLAEAIEDDRTGFLVPAGDVVALAGRLETLFVDGGWRTRMGVAAREAVARDFSWKRSVEATLAVYERAVAAGRGAVGAAV